MNKIFYTLCFFLFFSFFNNNAYAVSSSDVVACPKNASGEVVITTILDSADQTCDGEGATNVTLNIYSLGFCTSAPNVKFIAEAKTTDDRDSGAGSGYDEGTSDFSSCTWTIKESSSFVESLNSVGDVEPLPNDEIPPAGTYTHAVLVISNTLEITGTATFSQDINDGTEEGTGKKCWTNGTYFYDTGKEGPLQGPDPDDLVQFGGGGATCGDTPNPLANFIVYKYLNFVGAVGTACEDGCNTTRSEEESAFGDLTVLYTQANLPSLATNNPIIQRPIIVDGDDEDGTETLTNTMTLIFAYNTPMVVTDKTTGMEIFLNFSNALSLDFEPTAGVDPPEETDPPLIRAIQSGPFGIQFKSVEGGGTD